jgi:tetratricopeptide (TPR) repeat protein
VRGGDGVLRRARLPGLAREGRREALVEALDREVRGPAQAVDEALRLLRLQAALAAQRDGEPDDDALDALHTRGLEHAREAGDAREEAALVRWLARSILFGSTPASDGIERCRSLLGDLHGRRDAEAGVLEALASLQAMRGEFDEARELYVNGGRTYSELGQKARLARLTAVGTRIELLAGDRDAAERELRAAYETYDARGERASVAAVAASLARLTCEQGREEEAEQLAHVAEESAAKGDVTTQVRRRAAQAMVLARRGEIGEAEALAREAVSLTEGAQFPDWRADTLLDLADVLRTAGRPEEANAATRDALRLYEAKGNVAAAESVRALLG